MSQENYRIYKCASCESENIVVRNDHSSLREIAFCRDCEMIDFVKIIKLCIYCLDPICEESADTMHRNSCAECNTIIISEDENIINQKKQFFRKLKKLKKL